MPPIPHQGSKPDLLQLPIAFFWPFVFKLDVSAATVPEKTLIIYEKCLHEKEFIFGKVAE